jgi:hypothetical protein
MDRKGKGETPATTQYDRFVETARKLGANEDEAAFKEKLGVIARQKPARLHLSASKARPNSRQATKGHSGSKQS